MKANLGIRAHDLEAENLQELAGNVAQRGFSAVQLALAKSITEFTTSTGSLSPGYGHYVKSLFQQHDVRIAVLGCYINMIHPDLAERQRQLDRFKEHIRFARDFGCSIVGTETGSVIPSLGYSEDNFTDEAYTEVVKSVQELVEEAEKFGVIVGIEGGINHPIHTPMRMKRLLEDVPSPNLQVIYDPANFMSLENVHDQHRVIDEAFELFGDRIVIVHAKDFIVDNGEIVMVPVGTGQLDYKYLAERLKKEKPFLNILLENTRDPHIADSIRYIHDRYEQA
ncbi:sugar phosphate isomerase/epimerase family protein [Solibacillus sp. FSL W7-1436]|uniref:sugar phosphate isomerase/epimerase family protein n=1 Tax=Solibacillus sp. FSL W7-1436 TaxID=2921705 RepID=UPI0030F7BCF2